MPATLYWTRTQRRSCLLHDFKGPGRQENVRSDRVEYKYVRNPIALAAIDYHYYIFSLALVCVCPTLIWKLFPKNKGYALEELALLFDDSVDIINEVNKDIGESDEAVSINYKAGEKL